MRGFAFGIAVSLAAISAPALGGAPPSNGIFVDPESTTAQAAARLEGRFRHDALLLSRIASASWFAGGTPKMVEAQVRDIVDRAADSGHVPVLVAYNIPFRDCALYSAGGASDSAAYLSWIHGFATGIGQREAIVILEPDGLGVIPWHRTLDGTTEHCQPAGQDGRASDARYEQLRGAVALLAPLPNVRLYLDGTGSSWLAPSEAASRLIKADIARATGFFLNVSNFESDARVVPYARWVSDCIALIMDAGLDPRDCPSQFAPADFGDHATWGATDAAFDALFEKARLRRNPISQKHAVIDTSRNGRGTWQPPVGKYSDAEIWCNPPDRGLGRRPTLEAEDPYIDAFLWIKIPGESDGECHRGRGGPTDPERGLVAPAAGSWFPEQARELIEFANPPLSDD